MHKIHFFSLCVSNLREEEQGMALPFHLSYSQHSLHQKAVAREMRWILEGKARLGKSSFQVERERRRTWVSRETFRLISGLFAEGKPFLHTPQIHNCRSKSLAQKSRLAGWLTALGGNEWTVLPPSHSANVSLGFAWHKQVPTFKSGTH